MDEMIGRVTPEVMSHATIDPETFIEMYNDNKCEIVDIRMDFERKVWDLNFGLKIPLNELGERIEELPRDRLVVLSCPTGPRSIVAWTYLSSKNLNVKFLQGGLDALTSILKGGKAKEFFV